MKSVATKLDRSIVANPVLLIQRAISDILLQKFSISCLGSSVNLVFLLGLDKRENGGRVDLLLILDDCAEDLCTRGCITEVFFGGLPKLKCDGRKHRLSTPSDIVTVEVSYRKTISFSVPNPRSYKSLDPLGDFTIFGFSPVI